MDGLSLAASIVAVIQLAGSCLKLSRRWIGPSELGSSDLVTITTALYEFNGAMKTFQTHLEIHEDDEARLNSLDYLKPALKRCKEALDVVKDFLEHTSFISKHLIGPKFDRKLKPSLKALDGAKELFMLALHADQQTILHGVERYIRNIAEDIRDMHNVVEDTRTKLDELNKEQNENFKQANSWQKGAATSLKKLLEDGNTTYQEVKRVRSEQEDCQRQNILDWITPVDYSSQQSDFITRRQVGTGQWLLNSTEYQTWVETDKQTLFCPGIPGAGKTIITSIVVENLTTRFQNDKSIGIAYLYFNFRRQYEQEIGDLVASLLKQLIQGLSRLPDTIKSLYHSHKDKRTRFSFDEISRALQSAVTMYSRVFIVVDALDECQVSHNCQKKFLLELFILQAKCGTNLFATSRFIPEITENFLESISLEIQASEQDVWRYVDDHMSYLPSFVGRSLELQEEVKTEIVKAVDGMFLLAQLHLDSLVGKRSPKAIRAVLSTLPSGSDACDYSYKNAMNRIEGQGVDKEELAKQVLSWITCAMRPLTTLELQHALAVEVGESKLDKDNLPEIEDMVSVCAGLVTIDKDSNIIRLVHYTTQEYFERTQSHWFPNANTDITATCISYLSFDVFARGSCRTYIEFEAQLQSNQLFEYAAKNWGHHARQASTLSLPLRQTVISFLMSEAKVNASIQGLLAVKSSAKRPDYSQQFPKGMTGLHLIAYFGIEIVKKVLLETKAHVDPKNSHGETPLFWAARNGHEAIFKLLLESKADIDPKDSHGQTPLFWASKNGQEAVVKLLLEHKAYVDSKDNRGRTPLFWAVGSRREAVVKLLLENKAYVDSKDNEDRTPLFWAVGRGHEAVVKLLLENKAYVDSKDSGGRTPLSLATRNEDAAIVKLLLENKAYVDSKDNEDRTPLFWAIGRGHKAVVKLLLENKAYVDSKASGGRTPLSLATRNEDAAIVKLLLENKAYVDSKDNEDRTPLFWAVGWGHKAVVKLLLENKAYVDSKDSGGRTPLSLATRNEDAAIVKLLLQSKADIDLKDDHDWVPLAHAL